MRPQEDQLPLPSSRNALKQQQYRMRQQQKARPFAVLHLECRECGLPIAPSYARQFCPGGECRAAFFKKIQVPTFVPVTSADQSFFQSMAVLHG
ncbi:MAG TPA: hypothetical protein VNX26_02375 [Candidatus Acidoferrum sp.]|nr:hypothetical protein [Candidatus Acidoferrum sp.]